MSFIRIAEQTEPTTPPTDRAILYVDSADDSAKIKLDDGSIIVIGLSGGGDVIGPGSASDNALVRFDTTSGKLIQNSVAFLTDGGSLTGLTKLQVQNADTTGNVHTIDMGPSLTGIGLRIVGDDLTLGGFAAFTSISDDPSARDLVAVTNSNSLATGAIVMCLKQFANQTILETAGSAITTAIAIDVNDLDNLTSGIGIKISSSSGSASGYELLRLEKSNATATGSSALAILNNDGDTPSINISGGTIVQAHTSTTITGLDITADSLTTGSIATFTSNSTDTSARNLVEIINDNVAATGAVGLFVRQDSNASVAQFEGPGVTTDIAVEINNLNSLTSGRGLNVFANAPTGGHIAANFEIGGSGSSGATAIRAVHANGGNAISTVGTSRLTPDGSFPATSTINIVADTTTTGTLIATTADGLTSGKIANFVSDSASTSTRNLVEITNDNFLATGATCLQIIQDSTGEALFIEGKVRINLDNVLTGTGFLVESSEATVGVLAGFICDSGDLTVRNLVEIQETNVLAIGSTGLNVSNVGVGATAIMASAATGIALNVVGGLIYLTTTVSAATYTLLVSDSTLLVGHTVTAAVTITLPTAQTTDGRKVVIKDSGGNATTNNITIETEGAQTIDGEADYVLNINNESVDLITDGSNWFII